MRRTYSGVVKVLAALLAAALLAPAVHAQSAPAGVAEEDFTVTLGDGWVSAAKLTYPAGLAGPFPTLVIVSPGTDMDFTITPDFGVPDTYHKNMAEAFTRAGVAVIRYNKRYVTSATEADFEKFGALTPLDHRADAEAVLAAARANPRVDSRRLFVYGWSASTPVVAAIAADTPSLRGIILQGPIVQGEEGVRIWFREIIIPYLRGFAPDGNVSPDVIARAQGGDGGTLAKGVMRDFLDPATPDGSKVNPFFDADGNGVLAIDTEIVPQTDAWVRQLYAPGGLFANERLLPDVDQQAPNIRVPVLVLQGESDASTPLSLARTLPQAFAANNDFTFRQYPSLGHSLRATPDSIRDTFGPYEQQPVSDAITWLLARSSAPAALPRTAGAGALPAALLLIALGALAVGYRVRRGEAGRT